MIKELLEGKPFRHPLHPYLVHFPIGLFTLSFLLDIGSYLFPNVADLSRCSFYSMLVGVIMSLVAAIPGFVDYTSIRRDHPARKYATAHMVLNLLMVGVYAVNVGIRASALGNNKPGTVPFVLSIIGIGLLSISGYLGGTLVYDEGIAVGRHRRQTPMPDETLRFSSASLRPAGNSQMVFVEVGREDRLHEGETLRVEIDSEVMMVARHNGQIYAVQEFCTHRYGPLSEGTIQNGQVMCPWHGSCFDLQTGKVCEGPAKVNLRTFPVKIVGGQICIGIERESQQKLAA